MLRKRQQLYEAIGRARGLGVVLLKTGRVSVHSLDWRKGMPFAKKVKHRSFAKAFRSRLHAIEKTLRRAGADANLLPAFQDFQTWLVRANLRIAGNLEEALRRVDELASAIDGPCRAPNRIAAKIDLLDEESPRASLQDLIFFLRNPMAAAAKLGKLRPLVARERNRILSHIPKLTKQLVVIWQIWNFKVREAEWLEKQVEEIRRLFVPQTADFKDLDKPLFAARPDYAAVDALAGKIKGVRVILGPVDDFRLMGIVRELRLIEDALHRRQLDQKTAHKVEVAVGLAQKYVGFLHRDEINHEESRFVPKVA